jgi:dTDP-4-dehydro-6-deoxy-alpha-D-glucopyranose 2,3-dehydratase
MTFVSSTEYNASQQKELLFLKSALHEDNPFISTEDAIKWLKQRNEEVKVCIEREKLNNLKKWFFHPETGNLCHESGKFFSIVGIKIETDWGNVRAWSQPIINQPEIGFLGIITREIGGILYFLMQAKIEPGNVNNVQLSPTLQATKSNYTQIHKGKKPLYLEYFLEGKNKILLDQLQSEQGARFLRKRNRNIIIQVFEDIPVHEDFRWLTLGQIKKLMLMDNMVNMDTRTVISGIPFGNFNSEVVNFYAALSRNYILNGSRHHFEMLKSSLNQEESIHSFNDIISWLANLKALIELETQPIPLKEVQDWHVSDYEIHHTANKYFKVIGVNVEISNREVQTWMQPLVEPADEGICAFVVKKINGLYHFIVQAKLECGNFDILELAPTVQCITDNYKVTPKGRLPFLDYVLEAPEEQYIFDSLQSEEGGRFYREQNRNLIIEAEPDFDENLPPNYIWMTLNQLKTFIKFNNYLNVQSRSLIAAINFLPKE